MVSTASTNADQSAAITSDRLRPIVRRILNNQTATLQEWRQTPLHADKNSSPSRVSRITGTALQGQTPVAWSTVLKIIRRPSQDQTTGWQREAEVYRSGWLATLPLTFTAPTCYVQHRPSANEHWLWLADLGDTPVTAWTLERFRTAARHLGQYNGACLVDNQAPPQPWYSQHWLRQDLAAAAPGIQQFLAATDHPLLRQGFSSYDIARIRPSWAQRDTFLAVLDRLPTTICHYNANPHNLFSTSIGTVAIDWAAVGPGPIGLDPAVLFCDSLCWGLLPVNDAHAYEQGIFEAYIAGLRDTGWNGVIGQLRLAYVLALILRRLGAIGKLTPAILAGHELPVITHHTNLTRSAYLEHLAATHPVLHSLMTEAQALLKNSQLLP